MCAPISKKVNVAAAFLWMDKTTRIIFHIHMYTWQLSLSLLVVCSWYLPAHNCNCHFSILRFFYATDSSFVAVIWCTWLVLHFLYRLFCRCCRRVKTELWITTTTATKKQKKKTTAKKKGLLLCMCVWLWVCVRWPHLPATIVVVAVRSHFTPAWAPTLQINISW